MSTAHASSDARALFASQKDPVHAFEEVEHEARDEVAYRASDGVVKFCFNRSLRASHHDHA